MDTLPLRQTKTRISQSQRPPISKAGQSQTTMDSYLRPVAKVKQAQNDIRDYFSPVTKPKVTSNVEFGKARSPANLVVTPKPSHEDNGAVKCQTSGPDPNRESPADGMTSVPKSQRSEKRVPGTFSRAPNHNHVKSAVLPRFDQFFDSEEFPHSTSPMAPRVTEVVRHSLVPKPLNIKMPPPTVEANRSPSQTTSSPSSLGDTDTASLDGERREAPSFKQTYLSVHSRQNTNDSLVSPLTALHDPGPKPLRPLMDRPATLRSNTAPKLGGLYSTDSIIYFLPESSPTWDSSADEREPLMRTRYPKRMGRFPTRDVSKAKKPHVDLGNSKSIKVDRRKEALKDGAVAISPGGRTRPALTIEIWR